jgi:hypothetical protein
MANLRTITERVLRNRKLDIITAREFHGALTSIVTDMIAATPKRISAFRDYLKEKGRANERIDVAKLLDTANDLAKERQALKLALNVAVTQLYFTEPGDSRAVSDTFVALACVDTGDIDQPVIDVLKAERARLDTLDIEAVRREIADGVKLSVRIGRKGNDYPLPPELLDNKTVTTIIEFLRDTPAEQLRFLSKRSFKALLDSDTIEAEVDLALTALTAVDMPVLSTVWMFHDPESGQEYELTEEDKQGIANDRLFIHPETGMEVADYQPYIGYYWALNTKYDDFMSWKAANVLSAQTIAP